MAGHVVKRGPRWLARFPKGSGRYVSRTFDRRFDAQRWLDDQSTDRNRGNWTDPRRATESFGAVAEVWMGSRRSVASSTRARDESYFRNLILPYLGDTQLRHMTVEVLDGWVQYLDEVQGKAPATTRKAFQLAAGVLDRAVTLRMLSANPARTAEGIDLPSLDRQEMRFLSVDEVYHLAETIDSRYRALVLCAVFTGLRWGELAGLRAARLDLSKRRLTVAEVLTEVRGEVGFKDPKSKASARTVALPTSLVAEVDGHLRSWPATGDGLVFTSAERGPLRRTNFRRRVWLPAVGASVGGKVRFHDLRHTHAALLIAEAEDPYVISKRLGHASIRTTYDNYGHLFEGHDEAAAGRLDALVAERERHYRGTHADQAERDEKGKDPETLDA